MFLLATLAFAQMAQAQCKDEVASEQLFRDAMTQREGGDAKGACPKFEESQRLCPRISAQFYVADCMESSGKVASAWASFLLIARTAQNPAQETAARERATKLEPLMPRVQIIVPDDVRALEGLVVQRDGVAIGAAQWGMDVPADMGTQELVVTARGRKPWSMKIPATRVHQQIIVTVPMLAPDGAPPPCPDGSTGGSAPASAGISTMQKVGIAVGTVGLAGLGVGAYFGGRALTKNDDSALHCNDANKCDEAGIALRDDAIGAATISTVALVAGAVAVTGGVVLFVLSPDDKEGRGAPGTSVGVGPSGLFARGTF